MYTVHPVVAYAQAILRNLEEKTGRSLDAWLDLVKKEGPAEAKPRRDFLKKNYQLGNTTAWMIAERSVGEGLDGTDEATYLATAPAKVDTMFKGKEAFRPACDQLLAMALEHFPEVKICPCATIIPFYRKHVFAQIKPATKTRLELGLGLKGFTGALSPRLVDTGGLEKGDRITHRFHLGPGEMPDAEMLEWMRVAYNIQ